MIDATALRETVRLPEMRVNTFTGLREIPNDTIVEQLKQGTWECTFSWPSKGTLALKLSDDLATTGIEISRPDTVSLGQGLDGAVHRSWEKEPLSQGGYLTFSCQSGRFQTPGSAFALTTSINSDYPDGDVPSYHQLATIYVTAANAIRKTMACEGDPYRLPDLPEAPPTPQPLAQDDQPCDTFTADQLSAVLPDAKDSTTWNVWESPGDAFPSTACQIWRKRDPRVDPPVNEDEPAYLLGPRVGFSRITGNAAADYDLTKSQELLHNVEPWNRFGGKGYHADNQAQNKNKDNEMRLKRACGDETHVYVGAYAPHTVTRAEYEKLFAQWVRAQAQRDGCPVTS
ncbi:hypothetical protein [Haloechinothrix salitolerans]